MRTERQRENQRRFHARHRDRLRPMYREKEAKRRALDPSLVRRGNLRKYGLTIDSFNEMAARQDGRCAICRQPETLVGRGTATPQNLSVDHDHATGTVRGLLCGRCNRGLGHVDKMGMANILRYLAFARGDFSSVTA